jgi:mono/diheme cytochrome c family protein
MKSFGICRTALLATLGVACLLGARSTPGNAEGKAIFLANKCSNCHAISAAGIARAGAAPSGLPKAPPDLTGVGSRHTAAFIVKFLRKEETIEGRKHILKFKGTDDELGTLAAWLCTVK